MNEYPIIINFSQKKKLTTQQTYQYINLYQKNKDEKIKDLLVLDNLKLVISLTKRFYGKGQNDDLFQVGIIGLIKAIEHFDTSYQLQFSTYAVPLIIGEMKRYLRDNTGVKIPRTLRDLAYHILKDKEDYYNHHYSDLSQEELMKKLQVNRYQYVEALQSTHQIVSLQESLSIDGEISLIDQMTQDSDYQKNLDNHIDLYHALDHLLSRERKIIDERYFQGLSQMEIARELSLSQAQVSRIEKKALRTLHKYMDEA